MYILSFHKCRHLSKPNCYQDREQYHHPRKFCHGPSQLIPALSSLRGNHCSDYFYYKLVLPVLEFHMNGITQYVLFCVRFLSFSIMFSRFIHVEVYISSVFLVIAVSYFTVWLRHSFFIHSSISEHLGSYVHLHRSFSMNVFSFLLGQGLRVDHRTNVYLVL